MTRKVQVIGDRVRDKPKTPVAGYLQEQVSRLAEQQGVTKNAMMESLLHLGISSYLLMEASINGEEISTSTIN